MLEAVPKNAFSWDFTIRDGVTTLAIVDFSRWREKGQLHLQGETFDVYRKSIMPAQFNLEAPDVVLAQATKPSAFKRTFVVDLKERSFQLRAESPFRRRILVLEHGNVLGSISPASAFRRRALVDLPETLSLPVRVFMLWLALILWRRSSQG